MRRRRQVEPQPKARSHAYASHSGAFSPPASGRGLVVKEAHNPPLKRIALRSARLAFPYDEDAPTQASQRSEVAPISLNVAGKFRVPVVQSRRRRRLARVAGVAVPEAAVDLDRLAEPREHEIGLAGQVAPVQAESISQSVNQSTDDEFRRRVTALHGAHDTTSFSG
jgi:hypothetical protein